MNETKLAELEPSQTIVKLCQWQDIEAEADEMWSFVQSKAQQRWLWHAIDHQSGATLAYVLASHQVVPLGLVYGAPQDGISLTRYQDDEIPVIDVERRVFSKAGNLSLMSASPEVNDSSNSSENLSPQPVPENQRHLMIVEDIHGSLIGVPMDSPPTLRGIPKSAFSPIPAIYLAEGNIQCVSALVTISESEPPFFLLNLDQVLQQGEYFPRYSQGMAPKELTEGASRALQESFETRRLQP